MGNFCAARSSRAVRHQKGDSRRLSATQTRAQEKFGRKLSVSKREETAGNRTKILAHGGLHSPNLKHKGHIAPHLRRACSTRGVVAGSAALRSNTPFRVRPRWAVNQGGA